MTWIASFFFDKALGKVTALAAGLLALVVAFAWDQRTVGGERAIAKLNKVEAQANAAADRAADKSGAGGMQPGSKRGRGVRDPSTRDE